MTYKELSGDEYRCLPNKEGNYKVICKDGWVIWYKNGKYHRDVLPAVIDGCGSKYWYKNDLSHREDGPAIIMSDGTMNWFKNGLRHRIDGPSVILPDGTKSWHISGFGYSREEWFSLLNEDQLAIALSNPENF